MYSLNVRVRIPQSDMMWPDAGQEAAAAEVKQIYGYLISVITGPRHMKRQNGAKFNVFFVNTFSKSGDNIA